MQVVNKTLVKIHNKRTGFLCDITKNEGNKTASFLKVLYIMRTKPRKRFLKYFEKNLLSQGNRNCSRRSFAQTVWKRVSL